MKHWLVTVSFMLPYPREFTYRVQASHQLRAPAAALPLFKKDMARKKLSGLRMSMKVEPMGVID
jgi:hypothetical protein